MKKIYLLLILSLQGLFLTAQTVSINLDEQNIADVLTPDVQATATEIILSGHMTSADYAFVNACPKLTKLDMTDVVIDSIPQFCLSNATSLADLYLPKKETVFNFYAVKNVITNSVTAHITGLFPQLDVPTTGDKNAATDVVFTIEKGNERYFEGHQGIIFSANMDTLYRYSQGYPAINFYAKVIRPYSFAWLRLPRGHDVQISPDLELICQHAFEGIRWEGEVSDPIWNFNHYADLVIRLHNLFSPSYPVPRLAGPVNWNTKEYESINGSLMIRAEFGSVRTYLENSCLWAGVDMIDEYYHNKIASTLILNEEYYDKDGNRLFAIKPHFISSEWHAGTLSTSNITFSSSSDSDDGASTINADMDVEYGAYYTFVLSYTTVERVFPNPEYPYFHTVEYRDTILSPIPDGDDLMYEFEIYDDEGNLVFSNKRRGDKGSTEHLNGTLTNVPQSQQGDLKSRTTGMRFGESPWKSQRVSFGTTGIRQLDASSTSNSLYDLTGRPTDGTRKGIYIKDGKKIWVR